MISLRTLVEEQVRRHLNVSENEFEYLRHPSPNQLHDPFNYKDMRELVMYLRQFKKRQEKEDDLVLVIRSDYDTDGILAAVILTAALSVFGFRFYVYTPSMEDGYGFSKTDVDKMKKNIEVLGVKIGLILTADNGIASFSGVSYAASQGIDVLITDHHPAGKNLPNAKAVVDAYRADDLYPFKGNSGACVAWKAMLAYAAMFEKESLPLIERLIVFAGISNVADVMPMRGENRYTVTAAVDIVNDLLKKPTYREMADTPYKEYNTVFYTLFDLITILQQSKDEKRAEHKKKSIPLPKNEELFAWYISPLLNAPRRVHDTCLEGLAPFLTSDTNTRHYIIRRLIELNEEKSKLRDDVLNALPPDTKISVLCANTKKGISGLIAGRLTENSVLPSVVFSRYDEKVKSPIYTEIPTEGRLTGSARSNPRVPLDRIIEKINEKQPNLLYGAGHATAAGFSIEAKNYKLFTELFAKAILEVYEETAKEAEIVIENSITLYLTADGIIVEYPILQNDEIVLQKEVLNTKTLKNDAKETVKFLESLRPFGESFEAETKFQFVFDSAIYDYDYNPDFWKTFKCNLFDVEVLTFDEKWANNVKASLEKKETITAIAKLKLNEFQGEITPQFILSKKQEKTE